MRASRRRDTHMCSLCRSARGPQPGWTPRCGSAHICQQPRRCAYMKASGAGSGYSLPTAGDEGSGCKRQGPAAEAVERAPSQIMICVWRREISLMQRRELPQAKRRSCVHEQGRKAPRPQQPPGIAHERTHVRQFGTRARRGYLFDMFSAARLLAISLELQEKHSRACAPFTSSAASRQ